MTCPYDGTIGNVTETSQDGVNKAKYGGLVYGKYLQLECLLSCQKLESAKFGEAAHDEHLFIITHQAYELWFKQLIYELDSIRELFSYSSLDEGKTLIVISRLNRMVMIIKLLVDQFLILETMAPLDFMDFRAYLAPASGFQSLQFRLLENKLGVRHESRVKYNQSNYMDFFRVKKDIDSISESVEDPSLFDLVQSWLERTPGTEEGGFGFWNKFEKAAKQWLDNTFHSKEKDQKMKGEAFLAEYDNQRETFNAIFDLDIYNSQKARGERRLSHKAFQGAMMISLYRDEQRFHQPYQVLQLLMDIDSLLTKWRYNHVMLVQRMLGRKVGTGGSSGYHYLRTTVSDRYKVFLDLFNLSAYLIPRSYIPSLSINMKRRLHTFEEMSGIAKSNLGDCDKNKVQELTSTSDSSAQFPEPGMAQRLEELSLSGGQKFANDTSL